MENSLTDHNLSKVLSNIEKGNIFLDSYPYQVHFLMIDKCNVKCIMCGGDYFKSKSGRMITLEKFKTIAANLKLENARAIVLAGAGDPLLNKDLVQISQFVRTTYPHITITVTTNGLALTTRLSGLLLETGVSQLNISINSATRASYRRIMQVDGFDAVCRNAEAFVEQRKRSGRPTALQFSAAINRLNIEELPRLVELAGEIGVNSINLFYTRFYPERIRHLNIDDPADRLENDASLFYHQQLSDEMVLKAKTLARDYQIHLAHEPLFREHALPCKCTWPMTQLMVGFDGEIYPCGGSEVHFREKVEKGIYHFGNALQGPVDAYWNSEIYRALRISSRQGATCLIQECNCCANTISPNDIRSHIMQWDEVETESGQQPATTTCGPKPGYAATEQPLVSVIVPTYNRPEQLVDTLKSILAQTYTPVEIIVVNDGGIEVEQTISSLNQNRSITYVNHGTNRGLAAARNTAIKLARGKYIAYLDDDDLFYPRHVETLVHFLESGEYKVAYTDAYRAHQEKNNGQYVVTKRDVPYSFDFDSDRILTTNFVPVLCFMHARSCVDEVGLLDESLKRLEDWDMWIRLSRKYKFAHIKELTCEFSWRTDGTTMSSGQMQEFVEARKRIAEKYFSAPPSTVPRPQYAEKAKKSVVSIVILTFNQLKYTKECVESIRKHTPEAHEIIFVDNGSTDGTVKWLQKLVQEHGHYKLIENGKNLGFAKGCNQGIEAAVGEYVLLLNNDTVVTKDWLSGMLETLNSAPDIGIVGPMTNHISGIQKVEKVGYDAMDGLESYARIFREKNRHRRTATRRLVGFCMLFKRSLVDEIGLLDDSFGTGNFEDDDFCLRVSLAGYRNVIVGDVFIHHYGSRTFIGNRINYAFSLSGNRKIFAEKWSGIDVAQRFGKKLLIVNALITADDFYRQGQVENATASLLEAIKQAPDDRSLYFDLVDMLIDAKRYNDALGILESVPQRDPDTRQLALLGYCEEGLGHNDKAREYADRALAIDASMAQALNIKGVVAYKKGEQDIAERFFKKAIESVPSFGESYTNLGSLQWALGAHAEALNLFERGFILSPTLADVVTAYHSAVAETGSFDRAEPVFREARALHPNDKRIAFLLIAMLIQQENSELAMQEIEQAMMRFGIDDGILAAGLEIRRKIGPQEIDILGNKKGTLSLCMIVKNEEQHLAKCLMSVKSIVSEMIIVDTGSTDRTKNIALAFGAKVFDFTWTDDFSEARNYSLSKASGNWILVLDADEIVSPLDHGRLKQLLKNKAEKRVAYTMVTRNYTNQAGSRGWTANEGIYMHEEAGTGWVPSPKVRLFINDTRIKFVNPVHELVEPTLKKLKIKIKTCDVRVQHYGRMNQAKVIAKGKEYYRLGMAKIEKTKGDYNALKELAIQASEIGEYEEAVNVWQKIIELKSNDAVAFMNMGFAFLMMKQYDKAVEHSKKAMDLDPDLREAALNYSAAELIAGDVKKAIATLESILKKHLDYPPAMGRLVAACMIDGRREEGLRYLDRLNTQGFDCSGMLEEQSRAFLSEGKIEQAVVLLQAAIEKGMANGSINALHSECLQKINRDTPVSAQ